LIDTLARLSLHLLPTPSPSFTPLLQPLLTPRTIPNTLILILLDWSEPWHWIRQLRDWIRVLRTLISSLDDDCKDALESNIVAWRDQKKYQQYFTSASEEGGRGAVDDVKIPLGPGEWDEPLGLPICVVAQKAEKIEILERERQWKEEDFDFVLQYLRTILLKHGGSLMYHMPSEQETANLQTLVHSSLGIQSLVEKKQLRHNVVERDRVLVPPGWDSHGKIRILREGFDVEGVSRAWSEEIQGLETKMEVAGEPAEGEEGPPEDEEDNATAVSMYEYTIRDPNAALRLPGTSTGNGIEVECEDQQVFLDKQQSILEQLRLEDEREKDRKAKEDTANGSSTRKAPGFNFPGLRETDGKAAEDVVGPVQFNVGGIHMDADDMVKRIKVEWTSGAGIAVFLNEQIVLTVDRIVKRIDRTAKRRRKWTPQQEMSITRRSRISLRDWRSEVELGVRAAVREQDRGIYSSF